MIGVAFEIERHYLHWTSGKRQFEGMRESESKWDKGKNCGQLAVWQLFVLFYRRKPSTNH